MDNELRLDEPLPGRVIDETRAIYAPPGGDAYWGGLESRILARIADSIADSAAGRWWMVVGSWARGGLVAAAALLVAAVVGALLLQARDQEMRTAYESVARPSVVDSIAVPAGALSERDDPDLRGATFRDVISH
ncbi:MAG TPA: hypothetical protein VGT98_13320 [Candidatus Elarobacter sp.]|nr:hypothetical protein [Candidatus Elarobacter sp.]